MEKLERVFMNVPIRFNGIRIDVDGDYWRIEYPLGATLTESPLTLGFQAVIHVGIENSIYLGDGVNGPEIRIET